jgi:hypothetical protein
MGTFINLKQVGSEMFIKRLLSLIILRRVKFGIGDVEWLCKLKYRQLKVHKLGSSKSARIGENWKK